MNHLGVAVSVCWIAVSPAQQIPNADAHARWLGAAVLTLKHFDWAPSTHSLWEAYVSFFISTQINKLCENEMRSNARYHVYVLGECKMLHETNWNECKTWITTPFGSLRFASVELLHRLLLPVNLSVLAGWRCCVRRMHGTVHTAHDFGKTMRFLMKRKQTRAHTTIHNVCLKLVMQERAHIQQSVSMRQPYAPIQRVAMRTNWLVCLRNTLVGTGERAHMVRIRS